MWVDMAKRGIRLLDLASPFPGSQTIISPELATRLDNLTVISHRSMTSPGTITHSGIIQPLTELGFRRCAAGTWKYRD